MWVEPASAVKPAGLATRKGTAAASTGQSPTWWGKGCGRATKSVTGFCNKRGWAQNDGCKKLRLQAKEMDAQTQRERKEMDDYIESLFIEDQTASSCLTQPVTQRVAECATSG